MFHEESFVLEPNKRNQENVQNIESKYRVDDNKNILKRRWLGLVKQTFPNDLWLDDYLRLFFHSLDMGNRT